MRGWGFAALILCGLAGCAADRFAGVDLRPGGAPADVQALARSARGGDKQAQFGLAERLERGVGVPRDIDAARQLYRAAATTSGGTRMIFVPTGSGVISAVPVSTGATVPGLEEAKAKVAEAPAMMQRHTRAFASTQQRPPSRKRSIGHLLALGPSSACTTHRAAIAAASAFRIATCTAQRYRFKLRSGPAVELVDLALTTDDNDAIETLPIPFGLFDALELGIDGPRGATGTVTYDVAGAADLIFILRSFSESNVR